MPNFIYVFSEGERDKLLKLKYDMIKSDRNNHIYVFLNKEHIGFAFDNIKYALSDTLTF